MSDKTSGMSEAIAMHRSGNLSERAKRENEKRLTVACFGSEHVTREQITGTDAPMPPREQIEYKIRQLKNLVALASRAQGKKLMKEIAELERELDAAK